MSFYKGLQALAVACAAMVASVGPSVAERIDRGSQVIDGTMVNTTIYHERGYAVFQNDCGSQQLSQSALQAGAKPTNIIPCPRRSARPEPAPSDNSPGTATGYYGSVAATIWDAGSSNKVAIGVAWNYKTPAEARNAAVRQCIDAGGQGCQAQGTGFKNGGCGYVTTGTGSDGSVCWGMSATQAGATSQCQSRGCSCTKTPIGGCTKVP